MKCKVQSFRNFTNSSFTFQLCKLRRTLSWRKHLPRFGAFRRHGSLVRIPQKMDFDLWILVSYFIRAKLTLMNSSWCMYMCFRLFIPCIFCTYCNKVTNGCNCLFCVFISFSTLHVSGSHKPIIRGISSCFLYTTIWFMQCFVAHLRVPVDWFVMVVSLTTTTNQSTGTRRWAT